MLVKIKQLFSVILSRMRKETSNVLKEIDVDNERCKKLIEGMVILEYPLIGLETQYKQTKHLRIVVTTLHRQLIQYIKLLNH